MRELALETRRYTFAGSSLPVVYEASSTHSRDDVLAHVRAHQQALGADLQRHGAVLLRGFAIDDAATFRTLVAMFVPELLRYRGGDSPRSIVADNVYTSTSYPAALPIALHNEMSYSRAYPSLIAFYCETPAGRGGETPLADGRRVLAALSQSLRERLASKRLRYIQNLPASAGIGKSWPETFETGDRAEVEALLRARGAEYAWKPDGSLRVAEVTEPIVVHPQSAEPVFFSQPHLWHVSCLDDRTRRALLKICATSELYHHCTFGDGSELSEADLQEIRRVVEAEAVQFAWQKSDVLLVDNVLVSHGRRPFEGERRVLVAMG